MQPLEERLMESGFAGLFLYGKRSLADSIWENGSNQEALEHIVAAPSVDSYVKFLAAEVLRKYDIPLNTQHAASLAEAYAMALSNTSEEAGNHSHLSGNLWGFLYPLDDPGQLGAQLVGFGPAAIPVLTALLDDSSSILYEGSQEATLGNRYQYRVKDFAAFYLSRISGIPVAFHNEMAGRDQEIENLKHHLLRHN